MKLRKHFFPRNIADFCTFAFLSLILPFGYIFGIFIILPNTYSVGSMWYFIHLTIGTFLFVNIMGNYGYIMAVDTSIQGVMMPSVLLTSSWRYCPACDTVVPPRAMHCRICKTCILKRDHHCLFTGCCIGHKNHRYFICFLAYLTFACMYVLYYNTFFVLDQFNYNYWKIFQNLYFASPLTRLIAEAIHGLPVEENCKELIYVIFYIVNAFGMLCSVVFLHYYSSTLKRGVTLFEKIKKINYYDLGTVKENVLQVLGYRWYLVWIAPFIVSELPSDGVNWPVVNPKVK